MFVTKYFLRNSIASSSSHLKIIYVSNGDIDGGNRRIFFADSHLLDDQGSAAEFYGVIVPILSLESLPLNDRCRWQQISFLRSYPSLLATPDRIRPTLRPVCLDVSTTRPCYGIPWPQTNIFVQRCAWISPQPFRSLRRNRSCYVSLTFFLPVFPPSLFPTFSSTVAPFFIGFGHFDHSGLNEHLNFCWDRSFDSLDWMGDRNSKTPADFIRSENSWRLNHHDWTTRAQQAQRS